MGMRRAETIDRPVLRPGAVVCDYYLARPCLHFFHVDEDKDDFLSV